MLPFDKKPWARKLAAAVITVTLAGAIGVPLILVQRKALDLPIVVAILLLLLAIIPPNIAVLRQKRIENERPGATLLPTGSRIR
jgi:hypothetical protein